MIKWLKWFFTGHKDLLETVKKQQEIINELQKKEVFTVITPPREDNQEEYAVALASLYENRAFKWILWKIQHAAVEKIKCANEREVFDFCKGQLAAVDIIHSEMYEIASAYKARVAQ